MICTGFVDPGFLRLHCTTFYCLLINIYNEIKGTVQITMIKMSVPLFQDPAMASSHNDKSIDADVSWNFLQCFQSIHDICVPIFYFKSCIFMNLFSWWYAMVPCCQDKQNKWQNCLILFYFLLVQKRSLQSGLFMSWL